MSLRTVRSVRSLPSLRKSLHSSSTAPNPSHLLSSQQDTVRTHFASLTVNALKQECRQRGLKLMGRKGDLVERIVGFEQAKSFSSTPQAASAKIITQSAASDFPHPATFTKAFSTSAATESPESLDAYNVPNPTLKRTSDHPVTKIPVGPDSEGVAVELQSNSGVSSDTGASAGDIHIVSDSSRVSTMNVDLGDGAPQHDEIKDGYKPSNTLPPNDKTFLWGLGGVIAAWWGSQWLGKSKENAPH